MFYSLALIKLDQVNPEVLHARLAQRHLSGPGLDVSSSANRQRPRATSPHTARSHQHSPSWEGRGYFTWLLYDTTTTTIIIIPTMITVAALLLIGRDAARDLGMGGRDAGAVVDVTGRPLPLPQDAVSQGLAPLELRRRKHRVRVSVTCVALH